MHKHILKFLLIQWEILYWAGAWKSSWVPEIAAFSSFRIVPLWGSSEQLFRFWSLNRCECYGRTAVRSHSPGYKRESLQCLLAWQWHLPPNSMVDRRTMTFFIVSQLGNWELTPWDGLVRNTVCKKPLPPCSILCILSCAPFFFCAPFEVHAGDAKLLGY